MISTSSTCIGYKNRYRFKFLFLAFSIFACHIFTFSEDSKKVVFQWIMRHSSHSWHKHTNLICSLVGSV